MSGQSKVTNFDVEVVYQNIVRLDISMDNTMVVQVGKNRNQLKNNVLFLALGKLVLFLMQHVVQSPILYILHYDA